MSKKTLAPVDPDVKIPAAILAASARSDELHKKMYPDTQEPAAQEPVAQEPAAQEPAAQEPAAQEPAAPASPEPAPQDDFEHKYNSMKGRFDRSQEIIAGLNSRIVNLESLLARAEEAARAAPEVQNPDLSMNSISEDERETFGDEFLDVAARAAQEKINPRISQLEQHIASLQATLGNVAQKTKEDEQGKMYQYLTDNLPNWRELNRDPKFIAWCNLPDPFSGAIRMSMLQDAHSKSDGVRVMNFFKGFLADEAATDPAGQAKPEMPAAGKVPLETFAAPGRAKAPAADVRPGEKETITTAQISQFYADVNKGKYRGNEAEKARLEQMIFTAQAEGRVVR